MQDKNYEQRLADWSTFRQTLEDSQDPLQDVIDYYNRFPLVSIHTDPYDRNSWPDPWELIHENEYCDYCIILGMCYTLQLTDRFSEHKFEIHIGVDRDKTSHYYLLVVGDRVLGFDRSKHISKKEAFDNFESQQVYQMDRQQ